MIFYLGTHQPHWLDQVNVPLFVSRRRLTRQRPYQPRGRWALDSGAFTELSQFGAFRTSADVYAQEILRWAAMPGLDWAAPQDHMCEPFVLAKTGRTLDQHLHSTVDNFLFLRARVGPLVIPVLQGFALDDYLRCWSLYDQAGVDLAAERVVGLGSVCRRQGHRDAETIVRRLAGEGLRLHGFGVKITGLRRYRHLLASADSMAWSFDARRSPPIDGHTHKNCANCLEWALDWRRRVVGSPLRAAA